MLIGIKLNSLLTPLTVLEIHIIMAAPFPVLILYENILVSPYWITCRYKSPNKLIWEVS